MKESDYDIKKLVVMQQLEPRAAGLKLTHIGRGDSITMAASIVLFFYQLILNPKLVYV